MKDGSHNLHLTNKEADMANTTRSTKTSTSTKKAGAKTASAKKVPGKNGKDKTSKTALLRIYFVRQYPTFPSLDELMKVVPGTAKSRTYDVPWRGGPDDEIRRTGGPLGKSKAPVPPLQDPRLSDPEPFSLPVSILERLRTGEHPLRGLIFGNRRNGRTYRRKRLPTAWKRGRGTRPS